MSSADASDRHSAEVEVLRARLALVVDELRLIDARLAELGRSGPLRPGVEGAQLLRIEQVAERTGVAVSTLRHWRTAGSGPKSARIGRRVVYRAEDIDSWIDGRLAGT